jgi:hypothetical protein
MQLDYEETVSIQFSVTCTASSASRASTARVDFRVLPVNEFPPAVTPRALFVIVGEDIAIGTVLVSTRGDVGALTTSTFNENLTSFTIDEMNGTLIVSANLDVDNTPFGFAIEVIRVSVCDVKPAISSCPNLEVSLVVTSANDNRPVFSQDIYEVSIPEDMPVGSNITNVSCMDADVGAGAFSNITLSSILFNVSSDFRVIWLDGELTSTVYNVTLTCFDTSGDFTTATLIVRVEIVMVNFLVLRY